MLLLVACGRKFPEEGEIIAAVASPIPPTLTPVESAVTEEPVSEATALIEVPTENTPDESAPDSEVTSEGVTEGTSVVDTPVPAPPTEAAAPPADQAVVMVGLADSSNGETLFNAMNDSGFACTNCHSPDSDTRLVGPGLHGVPQRAVTRIEEQLPQRYLYNSIMHPNDYIVDTYTENLMPANYEELYTQKEIYDIVSYLMTLEDPSQPSVDTLLADLAPPVVEEVAPTEAIVEADTVDDTTEPTRLATDATTETGDVVVVQNAVTVTPIVIIVTATPTTDPDATPAPEDEAVIRAIPTINPDSTPDIVVTLSGLGFVTIGEQLYNAPLADGFTCGDCHLADSEETLVGPGLANVVYRSFDDGMTAQRYLYQAIVDPAAHPILSTAYQDELTNAQIYDLIAYLMSLESP
ncbi:MAG: c-type cytochrome [Aggregatilineales bacterium]